MPSHPDAPQDDEGQQKQQGHTAHQPQLLAADGVDKVGVPGREGLAAGGLGLYAVQVTLAKELAGTNGEAGAGLLPALSTDVQAVVKYHPEAHDPVIVPPAGLRQEKQPDNDRRQHDSPPHQHKPAQLDPGHPGHSHKNHHIDDTHAKVAADGGDQAQHKDSVSTDLDDGGDGADVLPVVLNFYDLQSQHQDEGDLYNLVGLNIHGEFWNDTGDDQPV